MKDYDAGEPDVSLVLLAGEILYQLRSSLDHLVHQLVILSGNEERLKTAGDTSSRSLKQRRDTTTARLG